MTVEELKKLCEKEIARGNGARSVYVDNYKLDKMAHSLRNGFVKAEIVKNTKDFILLS